MGIGILILSFFILLTGMSTITDRGPDYDRRILWMRSIHTLKMENIKLESSGRILLNGHNLEWKKNNESQVYFRSKAIPVGNTTVDIEPLILDKINDEIWDLQIRINHLANDQFTHLISKSYHIATGAPTLIEIKDGKNTLTATIHIKPATPTYSTPAQ